MALAESAITSAFTGPGGIIPGYAGLVQPSMIPTGQQVAPNLTQRQLDAQALTTAGIGAYQPFLTAGTQAAQASMAATDPTAADQYLNPYLAQQAATTMTDLNRLFGSQTAAQQQRAIQSGAFAGSGTRSGIEAAELARGQADTTAKALSNIYSGGYDMAQRAALQASEQQRLLSGQYGSLGQQAQAGLYRDVGALYGQGEAQRQILGQQNLSTYQLPFYALGQYASAVQGTPTFQQYQTAPPVLSGIAAGLGSFAGG